METGKAASGLREQMNRRSAVRMILGVGATAVAGGMLTREASATSGSTHFRTTTALNLRATASTSGKVLLVLPAKALVKNLGESSNGYCKVSYQGTVGWAYGDFLVSDTGGGTDPNIIGDATTTTSVNLRSGPSTSHKILRVLAKGKKVKISDLTRNGFRYVVADGLAGWIYDQLLSVPAKGPLSFKTTTSVNLRANASTSAKIIKVIPAGATVIDYDLVMANGFRGVDYKGSVGWIYDSYLKQQ